MLAKRENIAKPFEKMFDDAHVLINTDGAEPLQRPSRAAQKASLCFTDGSDNCICKVIAY